MSNCSGTIRKFIASTTIAQSWLATRHVSIFVRCAWCNVRMCIILALVIARNESCTIVSVERGWSSVWRRRDLRCSTACVGSGCLIFAGGEVVASKFAGGGFGDIALLVLERVFIIFDWLQSLCVCDLISGLAILGSLTPSGLLPIIPWLKQPHRLSLSFEDSNSFGQSVWLATPVWHVAS